MRKYQKMGCVRYAANDAKAAELESMGYTECTCAKKTEVVDTSLQVSMERIEEVVKDALKNIDNRQQSAADEEDTQDTSENTEEQEKTDSKPDTRRKSGKKRKAPETDSEAPAGDPPAPGGDDDGSDPTDNK